MDSRGRYIGFVLPVTLLLAACSADAEQPAPAADSAALAAAARETSDPWRAFWQGADGTVSALDTTRIAHMADGGVLVWTRLTYPDSTGPGDPFPLETRAVETQTHVDCAGGASAMGHVIARDARGRALVEVPVGETLRFRPTTPETAGSALVQLVCFTVGTPAP